METSTTLLLGVYAERNLPVLALFGCYTAVCRENYEITPRCMYRYRRQTEVLGEQQVAERCTCSKDRRYNPILRSANINLLLWTKKLHNR